MPRQNPSSKRPDVEKEFRFAVVMYGGVSLAIYINGVAQELYRMVRATARKTNEDGTLGDYVIQDPESTEPIYRELGEQLKARFIVDVLSGTSAGGINAVYLAKALAYKLSMTGLEDLWVEQGDIDILINDRKSLKNIDRLKLMRPPKSLLNSDRMYCELLKALQKMDEGLESPESPAPGFVDEVDLYITTTDLRGWSVPIMLADGETHENRYRTVFRFHHSTLGEPEEWLQDLQHSNNPFLAFAARTTSAFPFAFRPARLGDAKELIDLIIPDWNKEKMADVASGWRNLYRDYSAESDLFDVRSFGDGGALDNKPFSYITETLLRRQSDMPVDRRLFYIEPAPEHPGTRNTQPDEPNAIENVLAQAVSLPRYETIREDLLQIRTRNDLIERTNNILRQVGGIQQQLSVIWQSGKTNNVDWEKKYLDEILGDYGAGYASYHQLRVADTLDSFASALARNLGIDEDGTGFPALRKILEEWRRLMYSSNSKDGPQKTTENDLLYRLDLGWHIRRLHFVLRIIDELSLGLKEFRPDTKASLKERAQPRPKPVQELVMNSNPTGETWSIADPETKKQYAETLATIKHQVNGAYTELKLRGRKMRQRNLGLRSVRNSVPSDLAEYVKALDALDLNSDSVEKISKQKAQLRRICNQIEKVSLGLGTRPGSGKPMGYLHETIHKASERCKDALGIADDGTEGIPQDTVLRDVQSCLRFYYRHFEYFDMITFPITYATPIGESDKMEVYRISPDDAKGLFVEGDGKHKLAGITYGNFGGFLRKEGRQNDILWGKLDAAERIIVTLQPNPTKQNELLVRAWLTILSEKKEYLGPRNLQRLEDCLGRGWERFIQPEVKLPATELRKKLADYFADYKPEMKSASLINVITLVLRLIWVVGRLLINILFRKRAAPRKRLRPDSPAASAEPRSAPAPESQPTEP